VLVTCAAALLAGPPLAAAATPEYFPLPADRPMSAGLVADPDGNVWFGAGKTGAETVPPLGRITPSAATPGTSDGIALFPTPAIASEGCCANFIRDVAFDPANGRVWFVRSTGAVGYGTTTAMSPGGSSGIQATGTPTHLDLGGIAVAPTGEAWFTENGASNAAGWPGNRVARIDAGLSIHELTDLAHQTPSLDSARYDAKPQGIAIDPTGAPWFTEASRGFPGYRIAKVDGEAYQEYLLTPCAPSPPCSGSNTGTGPVSIAAAPDGSIWFTNNDANTFGRLNPSHDTITQYSLAAIDPQLTAGQPRSIRLAPDGTLWLAELGFISHPAANAIVRIVPGDAPTATVYHLGAGRTPYSVAPDGRGNVWFGGTTDTSGGFVGRLAGVVDTGTPPPGGGGPDTPPGGGTPDPPVDPGPAPQPGPVPIPIKPVTVGTAKVGDPRVSSSSLSSNQICVGPPEAKCSLVYLIQTHEYVAGFPGTTARHAASAAKKKAKPKRRKTRLVTVGTKTVTLAGGTSAKVTVALNAKGRKILKRDKRLNATFTVTQSVNGGKKTKIKTKKVTFKAKRGK